MKMKKSMKRFNVVKIKRFGKRGRNVDQGAIKSLNCA